KAGPCGLQIGGLSGRRLAPADRMERKEGPAMTGTMTFAGLDVHARSTHAAAIDVLTGELRRARFGAGSEEVVAWPQALPQPVYACYEAGTTGFAPSPASG